MRREDAAMSTPTDLVAAARRNATDICLAQVADSSAASHSELMRVLGEIGDDPTQLYALYRVLMGAVAALAHGAASEMAPNDPASQRAYASTMVRDVIANLELGIRQG